jgi:hypothetical protein
LLHKWKFFDTDRYWRITQDEVDTLFQLFAEQSAMPWQLSEDALNL